jgi:hypothetical protein
MKHLYSAFRRWRRLGRSTMLLAFAALASIFNTTAHAVPSYARQTGAECASCHIGGYGPQLTPYGIQFKLGGYTDTDGKGGKIPLSAMAVFNWTRSAKDNPNPDPALHAQANNNGGLQEASVFLAGRLTDQIGTFIQSTYSGYERKSNLDQMDIRYARSLTLGGQEGIVGLSLNSNPTLTDPFNAIGQWRFPYTESDFGFGSGPAPLAEHLGGSVMGLNAYTLWDKNFYAELGAYNTLSTKGLSMINADDQGKFKGIGTYWRLAYFKDMKRDNFSVGLFGFNAGLQPDRSALGTADRYRDIGIDVAYQFLGNRDHIYTVNASYIHEQQKLKYTFNNSGSDNLNNSLNQFKLAASYHHNQTWGVTGSLFNIFTSNDETLYGSNGRGNTSGYILQTDWTPWGKESSWGAPWANVRLGVQYTGYNKFNGGSHYLDDNGDDRKARDNNTLSIFVWSSI